MRQDSLSHPCLSLGTLGELHALPKGESRVIEIVSLHFYSFSFLPFFLATETDFKPGIVMSLENIPLDPSL